MTTVPRSTPESIPRNDWRTSSPFIQVTRRFVEFIQGLHAQCPSGAYRWVSDSDAPDENESEIWIGADNPVRSEKIGMRPAVTVLRGPGSFQGVGIGDRAFFDQRTGAMVRMDILPLTMTINVLSRVPFEAEQLAWFEMVHIWQLRNELMRGQDGIMFTGQRPSISSPSPAGALVGPDTEHNWTVVSVSFPTYLQFAATSIPLNRPILREMSVQAQAQRPQPKPEGVVPLQGTAVSQTPANPPPTVTDPSQISSLAVGPSQSALPQQGLNEGEYSEPERVQISITKD